jgi:cell cycle related kinase
MTWVFGFWVIWSQAAPRARAISMNNYSVVDRIGEGTFGEVYKAKHIATGKETLAPCRFGRNSILVVLPPGTIVALKKIRIRRLEEGIPKNLLREIQSLQRITPHPNVIALFDYFAYGSAIVIAVEYAISDLRQVLKCLNERGTTRSCFVYTV